MKKILSLVILSIFMGITTVNAQEESSKLTKTDEVLAKAAEKAINLAEKTGEFVIDQAPELLKEFYQWNIFSDIFWIIVGISILLSGRYAPHLWLYKEETNNYNEASFFNRYGDEDRTIPTWIYFVISLVIALIFILINLYDLLYLLLAPKLYLINYFIK